MSLLGRKREERSGVATDGLLTRLDEYGARDDLDDRRLPNGVFVQLLPGWKIEDDGASLGNCT